MTSSRYIHATVNRRCRASWLALIAAGPRWLACAIAFLLPAELCRADGPAPVDSVAKMVEENGLAASPTIATAGSTPSPVESNPLWLISTRNIRGRSFDPKVCRYESGGGWIDSSLDAFYQTDDPQTVTAVFVHGNDNDPSLAVSQGRTMYQRVTRGSCQGQAVRFVIWSWPSSRIKGPYLDNLRIKARRTGPEAFHLGAFMARLNPQVRLSLIGYSYGAPIVTGALHLVGGGQMFGRGLEPAPAGPGPLTRVVLLAAAQPNYTLMPGRQHGEAVSHVDRLLVMVNPQDRVLRFYPKLLGTSASALGYTGTAGMSSLGEDQQKVVHLNVACNVDTKHKLQNYMASSAIMCRLSSEALFQYPKAPLEEEPVLSVPTQASNEPAISPQTARE